LVQLAEPLQRAFLRIISSGFHASPSA
jgi:hypothetical protein